MDRVCHRLSCCIWRCRPSFWWMSCLPGVTGRWCFGQRRSTHGSLDFRHCGWFPLSGRCSLPGVGQVLSTGPADLSSAFMLSMPLCCWQRSSLAPRSHYLPSAASSGRVTRDLVPWIHRFFPGYKELKTLRSIVWACVVRFPQGQAGLPDSGSRRQHYHLHLP